MLRISLGTRVVSYDTTNGYGTATDGMLRSLERLGYTVNPNDPTADVEIWFEQPHHIKWSNPSQYKISYHPWESTKLKDGWAEIMNTADEVWTPSPLIAKWYADYAGIERPVYVYEHGIDPEWSPVQREVTGTFKFLHVGADASRKGAREVMHAFRRGFPRNADIELNMKMISDGWNIGQLPRINFINKKMSREELIQLYYDNHVFVYPSWGEGFGLAPLQAIATGMPTITVPRWAPYAEFLDTRLNIGSLMSKSPWPKIHPGNMLRPDPNDVIESMRLAYENYDELQSTAHQRTLAIAEYYSWDRLTSETFTALELRLKTQGKI